MPAYRIEFNFGGQESFYTVTTEQKSWEAIKRKLRNGTKYITVETDRGQVVIAAHRVLSVSCCQLDKS